MELDDLLQVLKHTEYLHVYLDDEPKRICGSPSFVEYILQKRNLPAYYVNEISTLEDSDGIIVIICERK